MTQENNITPENNELEDLIAEAQAIDEVKNQESENNSSQSTNSQKEIEILKDTLARTQADYQNFKFRTQRDSQDNIFYAKHKILTNLLPIFDDLERILKNTPEDQKETSVYIGTQALKQKVDNAFEKLGVKAFSSIGEEVNPDMHEVMTQIPNPEMAGKIVDEFEKGYHLEDRVLRVAKVVVGM